MFSVHHSKPRHQFSTLSDFICYFSCIYWFFWAKWPWNWKALQITIRKGWKLAWYHHFTHIACAKKLSGLWQKLATSCTKWTISFEVWGFRTKTHLLQRDFIFLTYFNSRLFLHSICTIQSHFINFQPFSDFICYFSCIWWFILCLNDPEIDKHCKWTMKMLKLGMVS